MPEFPNVEQPADATLNDLPNPQVPADTADSLGAIDPLTSTSDELDREVDEAMASLPSLGDDITPLDSIEPGTNVTGTIVGISDDEVFLEVNAKAQGVMPRNQFGKKEPIEVGRRVDVVVERHDPESDMLVVNRKGAIQRATWTNLSLGMIVEGKVTGLIKGGLEVSLQGIRAFMPGSQVSATPLKDISVLLGETVRCEVMELDRRHKNVLISRRKVLEKERAEARETLKQELEAGQTRRGVVKNITEFGAFVDLGGLEGLIHIRDLSWSTVDKVTDVLATGQEVDVQVLKVDAERNRISLGLKQALPDPWVHVPEQFPVGTTLKVRVVRVANFGAFAELEPGVEGLIPLSEMGWSRVGKAGNVVSIGDMVDAVVIRVEPKKRRLALSMKQAQPDPWDGVLDGYEENSLINGKVARIADFGVFVEVASGVEGMIHISELAEGRVKSCSSVVQVGQEVEARILGIDRENRRIALSLRRATEPSEASSGSAEPEPQKARRKRKKPLRGGLSSHFEW